jgi:Flp pilus assembly protein TadG
MVAAFAVVLTGMVGLSIDLGYAFAQRRTVQNAADSASVAGAHKMTMWSTANSSVAAYADVNAMVSENKMGASTNQTFRCNYVDDAGADLGNCSLPVPATATGVHVRVTETHDTFFIRVVPGAPTAVSTSADATAHVQAVFAGQDAPFVVCGYDTTLASGGTMSIILPTTGSVPSPDPMIAKSLIYTVTSGPKYQVEFVKVKTPTPEPSPTPTPEVTPTPTPGGGGGGGSSNYMINPAAIGQTFTLHAPHVSDCNLGNSSFKGLADQDSNENQAIPGWFDVDTGTKAGPTRATVNGINGCQTGEDPNGCILIVPVAVVDPPPTGGQFWVVTAVAFQVRSCGANCHEGILLGHYQIGTPGGLGQWTGSNGWKPGHGGLTAVRITN